MFQFLPLLLACADPDPSSFQDPIDLVSPLGPGVVRAGRVSDEAALFGGISAEGRVGDYKLYNDRVRFIVAGLRESDFMVQEGGTVVDADVTRPEDQPGRDLVDEWIPMIDSGRVADPRSIQILADGSEGFAALRVEGPETGLAYIEGAFETPDLLPDEGLVFTTDYLLEADSSFLEVRTTIQATRRDVRIQFGDAMMGSKELGRAWYPGQGASEEPPDAMPWAAFVSCRNEVTVGIFDVEGRSFGAHPGLMAFGSLVSAISSYGEAVEIPAGGSLRFDRLYGVGPDPATLSDALLTRLGLAVERLEGRVEAPDGPVPGARVNVMVGTVPYTMAFTDEEGRFGADLPAGSTASFVVDGHGTGLFADLPPGAASWPPYGASTVQREAAESLVAGTAPIPLASGRGWVEGDEPVLQLLEPGNAVFRASNGEPFEVRLSWGGGANPGDSRFVQQTPSGYAALAWARDGEVSLHVEPGEYGYLAWRGARHEIQTGTLLVEPGEETVVDLVLEEAYALEGWVAMDSHVHAAPSPDGAVTMEERLVVAAALGLDFHIATDHEHIGDYRPLLQPLGLAGRLASVPGNEMSSLLRGHMNLLPLEPDPELPNGGAFLWYEREFASTCDEFAQIRDWHPDALLQANHPKSGLASAAGWTPGHIAHPESWCEDFDLVEVANGGRVSAEDFYLDLVRRGLLVAPTSASDSHSHLGGSFGMARSLVHCGTTTALDCDADLLSTALRERRTIASVGPFLDTSLEPGALLVGPQRLDVEVLAPSWILVDTLSLLRDGEVVEVVAGTSASFDLDPGVDAVYHVKATGSSGMWPVVGHAPWALSSGFFLDAEGDGWTPPLPALLIAD